MCLWFLCNCQPHNEEGPEHSSPQTPSTGVPAASSPNSSMEHKNGNNYPGKNETPSKPHWEQTIINNNETSIGEINYIYGARDQPLRPHQEPSNGTENVIKGEHYTYQPRDEPPPKPRRMNGSESRIPKDGNQFASGIVENRDKIANAVHPTTNTKATKAEKVNAKAVHWKYDLVPQARDDPTPKPRLEPNNSSKSILKGGNEFASVAENLDKIAKLVHPKNSSMAINGEKVPVHEKTHDLAPHVGHNALVATPVQQPNLIRGNVLHTNGHYPSVDDIGRRNPNMHKEDE